MGAASASTAANPAFRIASGIAIFTVLMTTTGSAIVTGATADREIGAGEHTGARCGREPQPTRIPNFLQWEYRSPFPQKTCRCLSQAVCPGETFRNGNPVT